MTDLSFFWACGVSQPLQDFEGNVPDPSLPKIQTFGGCQCNLLLRNLEHLISPIWNVLILMYKDFFKDMPYGSKVIQMVWGPFKFLYFSCTYDSPLSWPISDLQVLAVFKGVFGSGGVVGENFIYIYVYIQYIIDIINCIIFTSSMRGDHSEVHYWNLIFFFPLGSSSFSMRMFVWFCHFSNTTMTILSPMSH